MAKKKYILIAITISILVLTVLNPVFVLGATRRAVLVDFIIDSQDLNGGFYEYKEDDPDESFITTDATRSSLAILNIINQLSKITENDQQDTISWLISGISSNIQNNNDTIDLALSLEGLEILEALDMINLDEKNEIISYLGLLQEKNDNSTGYMLSEGLNASVFGTYFALKCYDHLSNSSFSYIVSIVETENVTNFLKSCIGSNGGFKSDLGTESIPSLISTYYALRSLELMDTLGDIQVEQKNDIISFVDSFFIDNENMPEHDGGFSLLPSEEVPISSILATYYGTSALNLLGESDPSDTTIGWVLKHQNSEDGGFSENTDPGEIRKSSTVTSFYAIQILQIGDPDLSILGNEFLTYSIDWWLVAGIIVSVVAVIIAVIVIYKRRTSL